FTITSIFCCFCFTLSFRPYTSSALCSRASSTSSDQLYVCADTTTLCAAYHPIRSRASALLHDPKLARVFAYEQMQHLTYLLALDIFVIVVYLFCLLIAIILSIFLSFHIKVSGPARLPPLTHSSMFVLCCCVLCGCVLRCQLTLGAMTTIELREKHDVAAN